MVMGLFSFFLFLSKWNLWWALMRKETNEKYTFQSSFFNAMWFICSTYTLLTINWVIKYFSSVLCRFATQLPRMVKYSLCGTVHGQHWLDAWKSVNNAKRPMEKHHKHLLWAQQIQGNLDINSTPLFRTHCIWL